MAEKVKDFVDFAPFKLYIDFQDLRIPDEKIRLAKEYVITKEIEKHLKVFLETVRNIRKPEEKTLLIVGSYGTGKSYFLAFSCLILESLFKDDVFRIISSKLKGRGSIGKQLTRLRGKGLKLLPVKIDMKHERETESICDIIIKNLKEAVNEYLEKKLYLTSEWEEWIDIIQNKMKPNDRLRLEKTLEKKNYSLKEIVDLLKERDYKAIEILTKAFSEEFGFSPRPMPMDIGEICKQALRAIRKDFDGIVFLIDELQKYLEASKKPDSDLTHLEALCEET